MKKVLIAYGSRFGSTEEISEKISDLLKNENISSDLINLKEISSKQFPDLNNFDGVLIGSGIKIGAWTKEAKNYLKDNITKLKDKNLILGVFVSCGLASDSDKNEQAKNDYITKILNEMEIDADISDAFGALYDLSKKSKIGFVGKKIIQTMNKEDSRIKKGERNDLRDWNQIKDFTLKFADLINNK